MVAEPSEEPGPVGGLGENALCSWPMQLLPLLACLPSWPDFPNASGDTGVESDTDADTVDGPPVDIPMPPVAPVAPEEPGLPSL